MIQELIQNEIIYETGFNKINNNFVELETKFDKISITPIITIEESISDTSILVLADSEDSYSTKKIT